MAIASNVVVTPVQQFIPFATWSELTQAVAGAADGAVAEDGNLDASLMRAQACLEEDARKNADAPNGLYSGAWPRWVGAARFPEKGTRSSRQVELQVLKRPDAGFALGLRDERNTDDPERALAERLGKERGLMAIDVSWDVPQPILGRFRIDMAPVFGALTQALGPMLIDPQGFIQHLMLQGRPHQGSPAVGIYRNYGLLGALLLHEESVEGRFVHTGEDSYRDSWHVDGTAVHGTNSISRNGGMPRLSFSLARMPQRIWERYAVADAMARRYPVFDGESAALPREFAQRAAKALEQAG